MTKNKELREVLDLVDLLMECVKQGWEVQSVLCSKSRFKSASEAAEWCRKHKFKADKVDAPADYYRFRQFDPDLCTQEPRIRNLTTGVKAVVCPRASESSS